MQNDNFVKRLYKYSIERFHLGQFIPLTLILGGVLATGTQSFFYQKIQIYSLLISVSALFLFLFRLRIFDEFKDYEHDIKHYSDRPVPRGLISKKELGCVLIPVIFFEFLIAFVFGQSAIILFIISFLYSLLMFKEFFIKDWIKKHFTVYIASHEILIFPLFFYICALNGFKLTLINSSFFWLLVLYVGAFMFLLEVARKVRSKDSEIESRDTYTAQYGIIGASVLLILISVIAIICFVEIMSIINFHYSLLILIPIFLFGFFIYKLYKFNIDPDSKSSKNVFLSTIYFVFSASIVTIIIFLN